MTVLLAVVSLALAAAAAWFLAPFALRRHEERALARRCRERRALVLSYDDGPGQETTVRLLDLLAERRASAAFFPLGRNMAARPKIAARMVAEGHVVGSHTAEHSNAWKTGPWTAARDRDLGVQQVEEIGGSGRLFRPPYGKLTLAGWIDARRKGIRLAWWTLDSRDSWDRRTIDAILTELDVAGGGVVLMHDADAYERSGPGHADFVVELTRRLLDHAHAHRYQVLRLPDLLPNSGGGGR